MQLVPKKINGKTYWYLIRKGRKNGVPTNVETIYLGKPDRIAELLSLSLSADACDEFPVAARSREVGGSAALWSEAKALGLVELIDNVLARKGRRCDAAVSYGEMLVAMAIQRCIAPRPMKSLDQLQRWYQECGLRDFMGIRASGLDARRVDEALSRMRSSELQALEAQIVERAIEVHSLSLENLTFDATNFDSHAAPGTKCSLLRRGHAKSKRTDLRVLGLGMLATADGGIPLLSFPYPGNKADVTSFKSFLRRLTARADRLSVDQESTIAFDGGNISKDVVELLKKADVQFVCRLPGKHAPDASSIPTRELPWLKGSLAGVVRAKKLTTKVYGVERTVVAVFSDSMRASQVPGLQRDIQCAKKELASLAERLERQRSGQARKPLTVAQTRSKALQVLAREHLPKLFQVEVTGEDAAPVLHYQFDEAAWSELYENRLGRTLILTSRDRWSTARIVTTLRTQSYVEDAFKQMKDAEWAAALPLRHYRDRSLRVHAFVSVVGLLLATLLVRRLRQANLRDATVSNTFHELTELRASKLRYSQKAPARLKVLAKRYEVAPDPTPRQRKILGILKSARRLILGPTRRNLKSSSRPAFRPIATP